MIKNIIDGLPQIDLSKVICHKYLVGCKKKERFFNKITTKARHVLELIHSNVVGPLFKASLNRSKYFLAFIDDHSKKRWFYFLKIK
uniref:Integrase catalytic domain-containing protein n=2 Tax=Physcomitrium patens TaxID=3218 RepID=A0A2K1KVU0_PHYPA|nr:hypothetical protein PHYPA_004887 [Physcomitrium patens]